jgi:hypothetical protein
LQEIPGRDDATQVFRGVSGWYPFSGSSYREADRFTARLGPTGLLELRGDAERPLDLVERGPPDGNSVAVVECAIPGPGSENVMTVAGFLDGLVSLGAGPATFGSPDGNHPRSFGYVLHLDGAEP